MATMEPAKKKTAQTTEKERRDGAIMGVRISDSFFSRFVGLGIPSLTKNILGYRQTVVLSSANGVSKDSTQNRMSTSSYVTSSKNHREDLP